MILAIETHLHYADTPLGYIWQANTESLPGVLGLGTTEAAALDDLFEYLAALTEH